MPNSVIVQLTTTLTNFHCIRQEMLDIEWGNSLAFIIFGSQNPTNVRKTLWSAIYMWSVDQLGDLNS